MHGAVEDTIARCGLDTMVVMWWTYDGGGTVQTNDIDRKLCFSEQGIVHKLTRSNFQEY